MAQKPPSLYSIPKTFVWFAIISLLLTGSLVAIVILDHSREWKVWQKKFIRLKTQKTQTELKTADQKIDRKGLEDLQKQIVDTEAGLKSHRAETESLNREIGRLDTRIARATADVQNLKQFQDSYRYFFEEHNLHRDTRAADYDRKLKDLAPRLETAKQQLEMLQVAREAKEAELQSFTAKRLLLLKDLEKVLDEKKRIEQRIEKIKPTLAKDLLNAPLVDFIAPTLKIQQVVLDDLQDDYHFARVQKVDRCTTCHLGIDSKAFEDAPQPFKTHPKLELYLGSQSPHPIEKFGCTVCHSGSGHSVSFKDSAHTPRNAEQAAVWRKKYRWQELEKWDEKMLPLNHIQASCARCHSGVVEVPRADKLNRGRALAQTHGCFSCHKVAGFENRWKTGPDLQYVQSKLSGDWIAKWLEDPTQFRSSTKMPRVLHLSNHSSPPDNDRDTAAAHAIAYYLVKNSKLTELTKPPVAGDAARGEQLVKKLGCLGCHSTGGATGGDYGPELSGLGSKVSAEWLYTWLKDPKHYSPQTRMPSLRLTDAEAADIASFLLSQKNESFDRRPAPKARPEVVDRMILESLEGTQRRTQAESQLAGMSAEERLLFLGKRSIAHQGCYACHAIAGFQDAKPIGTELSNEGQKAIHQFDFGFSDIERSRQAWIAQKLKDPRSFDQGKIKTYYEKLRMPHFNLSDEEIEELTTFILSLSEEPMTPVMQRRLDLKEKQIEEGRLLVSKLNCVGCHTLDGKEGFLRKITKDAGVAPPVLDGEGQKVQEKWLHDFLKSPGTIRPWLTYRMPSFDLSEEELTALVRYFDNLDRQEASYQGLLLPVTSEEKLRIGKTLFNSFQCVKCHQVSKESVAMGASFLAPDLTLTKRRLKPDWVVGWMRDPEALQPGTMMPGFFPDGQSPAPDVLGGDSSKQIEAIRDYLFRYEAAPAESGQTEASSKNPVEK